jgi:hypothetical protein
MSTATSASDNTWTHVASRRRPEPTGWGTPTTRTPAPVASTTRPGFSFSSAATVAALEGKTPAKKPAAAAPAPWKAAAAPPAAAKQPDLSSMRDFPTLGGGSAARPTVVAAAPELPSWARTVKEMAAREDAAEEEGPYLRRRPAMAAPPSHRSRLAMIGTRCFDDGPADYDAPEEDDDGAGSYREERAGTPAYDAEGDELNAELAVTRRAGDKSDW